MEDFLSSAMIFSVFLLWIVSWCLMHYHFTGINSLWMDNTGTRTKPCLQYVIYPRQPGYLHSSPDRAVFIGSVLCSLSEEGLTVLRRLVLDMYTDGRSTCFCANWPPNSPTTDHYTHPHKITRTLSVWHVWSTHSSPCYTPAGRFWNMLHFSLAAFRYCSLKLKRHSVCFSSAFLPLKYPRIQLVMS